MAKFGTIEVFDELAKRLNEDEEWAELGKPITYTMVYAYGAPVEKNFFLRFDEGRITDVLEVPTPDAEPVDFVLTADPEVWRAVMEKRMKATVAITTGKIKVKGNLSRLMKHMRAFSRVLDVMIEIELV